MDSGSALRNVRQVPEADASPIDLREKAATLSWETRRRWKSGYFLAAYCTLQSVWDIWQARNAVEIAGDLVAIGGAVFLAWQWRRFAAPAARRHDLPGLQFLGAYREELMRQKRLALSVGVWSVVPLVLGIAIAGAGHLAVQHALRGPSFLLLAAFVALVLCAGLIFAMLQIRQIEFRIDEVEAALRDG